MTIYYLKCIFRNCINGNYFSYRSFILSSLHHQFPPHSFSESSFSSSYACSSGSGGTTGSTSKFLRNLACFSNELLLFKFLLFTFTLNPWIHRLLGRRMLLSSALQTWSRCPSGSNGCCSSFKSRPSNSTGPNMNGLGTRASSALLKLAGT